MRGDMMWLSDRVRASVVLMMAVGFLAAFVITALARLERPLPAAGSTVLPKQPSGTRLLRQSRAIGPSCGWGTPPP